MNNQNLLKQISSIAICLALVSPASAQNNLLDINDLGARMRTTVRERLTTKKGFTVPLPITHSGAQKPTAANVRLVTMYALGHNGTEWVGYGDSSQFFWSGTRGADFDYARFTLMMFMNPSLAPVPIKHELEVTLSLYPAMNMDSMNGYVWNGVDGHFSDLQTRTASTLNSAGLLSTLTQRNLVGGNWENATRNSMVWDANGNLIDLQADTWDGAVWEPDYKSVLSYDADNNPTTYQTQNWDIGSSSWENDDKTQFTYVDNELTQLVKTNWSTVLSSWINDYRNVYGYDNGKWITTVDQVWDPVGSSWESDERVTYSHDGDGRVTQALLEEWDLLGNSWENDQRIVFAYDANGDVASVTVHDWDGASWEPDERYVYTYSTSGNETVTTITIQEWDGGASVWENDARILIKRNEFDRVTEVSSQSWDAGGFWDAANGDARYVFKYETFDDGTTTSVDEIVKSAEFSCYPNPASDVIHVASKSSSIDEVRLIDITGRTIQQLTPDNQVHLVQLSTAQLTPGTYFLQVKLAGATQTITVQVMH